MRFWLVVEILGSALALFVLGMALWLRPDPSGHGTLPQIFDPCPYLAATGKPCLTCGMTTCFVDMAHGRVEQAVAVQPAGVLLFLLTLIAPLWLIQSAWTGRDPFRFFKHPLGRLLFWTCLISLVAVWWWRSR